MDHSLIRVDAERQITEELRELFSAEMVERILQDAVVVQERSNLIAWLEGRVLRISEELVPDLYQVCRGVCDALDFDEPIEFFVVSAPEINAAVMESENEDVSHAVLLNSGAVDSLSKEELSFVIGHELGHLICGAIGLQKVIRHIYPEEKATPLPVRLRLERWRKLEEMSADRYGLIACGSFDVAQAVMVKLSSGLDLGRYGFEPAAYSAEIDRILAVIEKSPASNVGESHPEHPLRVKALSFFWSSGFYRALLSGEPLEADPVLSEQVERIGKMLVTYDNSPLDMARRNLVGAGGLLLASADGDIADAELEMTIDSLARYTALPAEFLNELSQDDDLQGVFVDAAQLILEVNPAERYGILKHLAWIAMSDQKLVDSEVEALYLIGTEFLGLSRTGVAQELAGALRESFAPRLPIQPSLRLSNL